MIHFPGESIYYLGIFTFGASLSTPESCATKLVRLDGIEQLSVMCATALSPLLYKVGGFIGSFAVGIFGNICALLFLLFYTPGR